MPKNILITGSGKRIGAACAVALHAQGHNIVLHYRHSKQPAEILCQQLNQHRSHSAVLLEADLMDFSALQQLAQQAIEAWGGIDALVNNASAFYPQAVNQVTLESWDELMGSNLKAPFFLAQALEETLSANRGCIVNMVDIHAERGLKGHPVYSIAKAGLAAMTKILAKEFAPDIRVNAIAPGAILWPQDSLSESEQAEIIERIALNRCGETQDIVKAVDFLIHHSPYITGQIISIDGGRSLFC